MAGLGTDGRLTGVRTADALALYEKGRRDINQRLFMYELWPSAEALDAAPGMDESFIALYKTLWLKHALLNNDSHALTAEQTVSLLARAWHDYSAFIEMCIGECGQPVRPCVRA